MSWDVICQGWEAGVKLGKKNSSNYL